MRRPLLWTLAIAALAALFGVGVVGGARPRVKPCHGNSCHTTSSSTTVQTTTATTDPSDAPLGPTGTWTQVFADNFTTDTSLNTAVWANENWGTGCSTSVDNTLGLHFHLSIAANGHGCQIRSLTKFTYGAFEAAVWMPANATGTQGADHEGWWTAGDTWPNDGEFDIAEAGGSGQLCAFTHAPNYNNGVCPGGNWFGAWHTYTAEWFPNPDAAHSTVIYYWDGAPVGRVDNLDLTTKGQYLRMNLFTNAGETFYAPADMYVKYVKVWQR